MPSPADQKSCERMHPDQQIRITASGGFKVAKPLIKFVEYPLVAPSPMGGSMAQFATCQFFQIWSILEPQVLFRSWSEKSGTVLQTLTPGYEISQLYSGSLAEDVEDPNIKHVVGKPLDLGILATKKVEKLKMPSTGGESCASLFGNRVEVVPRQIHFLWDGFQFQKRTNGRDDDMGSPNG